MRTRTGSPSRTTRTAGCPIWRNPPTSGQRTCSSRSTRAGRWELLHPDRRARPGGPHLVWGAQYRTRAPRSLLPESTARCRNCWSARCSRFAPGVTINHDLPAAAGPNDALGTWLDGCHEGGHRRVPRRLPGSRAGPAQSVVRDTGRTCWQDGTRGSHWKNGLSGVWSPGTTSRIGRTVRWWVYVYDNNVPFVVSEDLNSNDHHYREIDRGIIRTTRRQAGIPMGSSTWVVVGAISSRSR